MQNFNGANRDYSLVQYAPKGSKEFCNNLINKITSPKACKNWEKLLHIKFVTKGVLSSKEKYMIYKV